MSKYGFVDNGEVTKISSKPTIEGMSGVPNETQLKDAGWLPIIDDRPSLLPWQRLGARTETVGADSITFSYAVVDVPLSRYKQFKVRELITNGKNTLEFKRDSFDIAMAALGVLPAGMTTNIQNDASAVVSEIGGKRTQINNATTYLEVDAVYTGITAFMDPADVDENGWPIPQEDELI